MREPRRSAGRSEGSRFTEEPVLAALTRGVNPRLAECELTELERSPIDVERARAQHEEYRDALRSLGCEVRSLPTSPDLPDSVFIEDTAVVLPEIAILARPGAESRRPEVAAVADALRPYRQLGVIDAPGTLEGGDVLRIGRTIWVGVSRRTNRDGFAQFRSRLEPRGYDVREMRVKHCLHLKSAVTGLGESGVLVNPAWVDVAAFAGYKILEVDSREPFAANALSVGNAVVYSSHHPRTRDRLAAAGHRVVEVDASELAKAEGAVTCCSILFEARG